MGCGDSKSYLSDPDYDPKPLPTSETLGVFRIKNTHWSTRQGESMYLQVSNYDVPDRWRQLVFVGSLNCHPHRGLDSSAKSLFSLEYDRQYRGCRLRSATFEGEDVICSEYFIKDGWRHQASAVPLHAPRKKHSAEVKTLLKIEHCPEEGPGVFRLEHGGFPGKYLQGSDVDVSQEDRKRGGFFGALNHAHHSDPGHKKSLWVLEPYDAQSRSVNISSLLTSQMQRATPLSTEPLQATVLTGNGVQNQGRPLVIRLSELKSAFDEGYLTKEEYDDAKKEALRSI